MKTRVLIKLLVLVVLAFSCESNTRNNVPIKENQEHKTNRIYLIKENDKIGFIDSLGSIVVNPQFEEAQRFSEGLACVKIGNDWGYIDTDGKFVINPQFDNAYSFSEGLACVEIGSKWGYINTEGKYVINPQFDDASIFSEGLAAVEIGKKWGYIDIEGKFAINPQFAAMYWFDLPKAFSEGLAAVKIGDNWGFINKDGEYAINPQFDDAKRFHEGLAAVKIGDKWGYINTEGKYVINPQFEEAGYFGEGLAAVKYEGKYGYVESQGNFVINPRFEEARRFSNGFAAVKIGGKCGYINKEGNFVINPQFEEAWGFYDGIAEVELGGNRGYINKEGIWVWKPEDQDNIRKLYCDAISRGYKASEEEFRSCINGGTEKRKHLFNELKALGMRADEATFMEYVGFPMANPNEDKIPYESIGQTHTSHVSDSQSAKEERDLWSSYYIPKVCSIAVPPTMEIRDENFSSGRLFSAISPSLYKLICENCDVFSDQIRFVFQPKGMNSSNPQDIDRATATYARIIIEFGYNDVGQEDVVSMTSEDFKEYDEIVGGQYKADFDYAQQSLGQTGSFVWHPTKRERIAGKYCLITDYDRSGLHGMVKVKKYIFYFDGKEIDVTCSYRISEKQKYEKDFEKVIRSIKFD